MFLFTVIVAFCVFRKDTLTVALIFLFDSASRFGTSNPSLSISASDIPEVWHVEIMLDVLLPGLSPVMGKVGALLYNYKLQQLTLSTARVSVSLSPKEC